MESGIGSLPGRPALIVGAALLISASTALAQSNNPRSQIVYLPDPTPRETDPRLRLGDNSKVGTPTQDALEHRNAKRRELVEWAANELVVLSQRLQSDVTQSRTGSTATDATGNAQKIEVLAKNLTAALKAP